MNRNLAGNGWADATRLVNVPHFDQLSSVAAVDLLGNGTSCLVWSTSRPADARRSMLYLDLMGGQKAHLLTRFTNNLGCETRITYAVNAVLSAGQTRGAAVGDTSAIPRAVC